MFFLQYLHQHTFQEETHRMVTMHTFLHKETPGFFCYTFAVTSQDADALCREHHSEFVFWYDTTMNITFASVLVTFCCQNTKADSRVPVAGICWARSLWIMFLGPEFWCVPRTMRTQFDLMHVTSFRRPFLHALPKERLVVFGTHGINENGLGGNAIIQF